MAKEKILDLSIIIPTYNRLWNLPKLLSTCISNQFNIEIIVIDDGSTDGTYDYCKTLDHIHYIRQVNLGKCWAVNKGFELTKGKYIKFMDSDDLIPIGILNEQISLALQTQVDVVVAGYLLIDEHDEIKQKNKWVICDDFIAQQLGECDSSHYSAYLFKRDFLLDIPHRPDFAYRDDRLLVLEAALKKPKIAIYEGYGLSHRQHSKERLQHSVGLKETVQNYQHLKTYERILGSLAKSNELTLRRINAASQVLWPLAHWIAKRDIIEGQKIINWIYMLNPDFKIPEKGMLGKLYNTLGFSVTQRILSIRRILLGR